MMVHFMCPIAYGRPRQAWASEVYQHVVKAAGGAGEVQRALCESEVAWADTVRRYVENLRKEAEPLGHGG